MAFDIFSETPPATSFRGPKHVKYSGIQKGVYYSEMTEPSDMRGKFIAQCRGVPKDGGENGQSAVLPFTVNYRVDLSPTASLAMIS